MASASVVVDVLIADPDLADGLARVLLTRAGPQSAWLGARLVAGLELVVDATTAAGWLPTDLVRVVSRRANADAAAVAAAILHRQAQEAGPGRTHPDWQFELEELPPGRTVDASTQSGLRDVLLVLAALRGLPALPRMVPPPGHPPLTGERIYWDTDESTALA